MKVYIHLNIPYIKMVKGIRVQHSYSHNTLLMIFHAYSAFSLMPLIL